MIINFAAKRELFPQLFEDYEHIGLVKNSEEITSSQMTYSLQNLMTYRSCLYLMSRHNNYFYIHMFCLHGNYYVFCHKDMREQLLQEFVLHIYHENNPRRRDLEFGFLGNLVETSLFPARYNSVSKITIH